MKDWELFVEIAKRMGAHTARNSHSAPIHSVNLNGIHIAYDLDEERAYVQTPSAKSKSKWLDNDILVWIDTLRGALP